LIKLKHEVLVYEKQIMSEKEDLKISFIIPVYNRPEEIVELLDSLKQQTNKSFEIIIVEDGSTLKCDKEAERYQTFLDIKYFYKENTGPGISRNVGCEKASGNYCIFLDSDCILPPHYVEAVYKSLTKKYVDAFGGPDKAHESFTNLQKAINYSMTSFFTTGGIRGGGEKVDKFYPRSFNMGISQEVFKATGGFPSARFAAAKAAGEDIELSINIYEKGYKVGLLKDAYVYHKRRTNLKQFFNQVYNFGYARISLHRRNKGALKAVHALPSVFTLGLALLLILTIFVSGFFGIPVLLLVLIFFFDASIKNKNLAIGVLAVVTSFIQLIGYGLGFMNAFLKEKNLDHGK
jgi:glycosyltransferase involved in cell wall biosynthesis